MPLDLIPSRIIRPSMWVPGHHLPLDVPLLPSERARWARLRRMPWVQQCAITETPLTSGSDDTDTDIYTSASITPPANELILAAISAAHGPGTPAIFTATGNGLTWVEIANVGYGTVATPQRRITLFRAMGSAPSAGAVTFTGDTIELRAAWAISAFAGVNTGGTNGSAAIRQPTTGAIDSNTALTITLGTFDSAANGTYGAFGIGLAEAQNAGTGFTEIHDTGGAELNRIHTIWRPDNDTTVDASSASSGMRGAIALELVAAVVAVSVSIAPPMSAVRITMPVSSW